jgi:hypothetical protein
VPSTATAGRRILLLRIVTVIPARLKIVLFGILTGVPQVRTGLVTH